MNTEDFDGGIDLGQPTGWLGTAPKKTKWPREPTAVFLRALRGSSLRSLRLKALCWGQRKAFNRKGRWEGPL